MGLVQILIVTYVASFVMPHLRIAKSATMRVTLSSGLRPSMKQIVNNLTMRRLLMNAKKTEVYHNGDHTGKGSWYHYDAMSKFCVEPTKMIMVKCSSNLFVTSIAVTVVYLYFSFHSCAHS